MKSTSLGCMSRRPKVYAETHAELRREVSLGVNGHRGDLSVSRVTPWEFCVLSFAWGALLGFAIFAVVGAIRAM